MLVNSFANECAFDAVLRPGVFKSFNCHFDWESMRQQRLEVDRAFDNRAAGFVQTPTGECPRCHQLVSHVMKMLKFNAQLLPARRQSEEIYAAASLYNLKSEIDGGLIINGRGDNGIHPTVGFLD